MLSLKIQKLGDTTVFQCAGRITLGCGDALQTAISRQQRIGMVVLDLAEISAIDAAGLGILLSLREHATASDTKFKLMNLTPRVEELLELTNVRSAFEVCSAREMLDLLCRAIHQSGSEQVRARIEFPGSITRGAEQACYNDPF